MNPLIGAGLIAGAGSLIGGIFGGGSSVKAQRLANEANLRMNAENNQLQRDLANQKYEKDLEQWHRQNAYNSPEAQAQRYREAGINPYLADISGGQATSSPEMALAQTQAGRVEPIQGAGYIGESMANAASMFGNTYLQLQQAKQIGIDNKSRATKNMLEIEQLKLSNHGAQFDNKIKKIQSDYAKDYWQADLDERNARTKLIIEQEKGEFVNNAIKQKQLDFLPEQQRLERLNSLAEISLKHKQGILTDKQVDYEIKKLAIADAQIGMYNAQADLARDGLRVNQAQINNLNAQAGLSDEKANTEMYDRTLRQALEKEYKNIVKWNAKPTKEQYATSKHIENFEDPNVGFDYKISATTYLNTPWNKAK